MTLLYSVYWLYIYLRYLASNELVVNYNTALFTTLYSLYSLRYSLWVFSYATTCTVWVLPVIIGTGLGFIGGVNVDPINI